MPENLGRVFGACAALAGLWILVYWWWQPAEPRIRFGDQRTDAHAAARQGPDVASQPTRAQSPPQQPAVLPPGFREYTVRDGDTLGHIAQRELGSALYADAISRANPYINLDQIRAGRVIRIPLDPGNIQGRPTAQATSAPVTSHQAPPPLAAPPPSPPAGPVAGEADMTNYIVQPGDTLTLIARRHYGSIRYATLIYEANRDQLPNEDELHLGQKLRLPPKPD